MNISILGAGSWGTANAVLLANARHSVTVWGRSAEDVDEIRRTGMNAKYLPGERLSAAITWTADPASAVKDADIVVIAVPSRHFEEVCRAFSPHVPAGATVVSLAKGFCPKTHRRMSGRQRGQSPRATMRRTFIRLAVLFVALFAARPSASAAINPCELSFVRLASRRFVLDNELTLCEYKPQTAIARSTQYPVLTNAALRVVGGYWPAAHYKARVTSLPAEIAFATAAGEVKMRVGVDAKTANLPALPFDLSVVTSCDHRPSVLATKDGRTTLIGVADIPAEFVPSLKQNLQTVKFCVSTNVTAASASLTAGIGQADIHFVTTGRENRLYMEGNRAFFTFSSRNYGAFQGVASFDPSIFDVRLEGVILFDYGDGKLRNDLASHLFHDVEEGSWKGYVGNFGTGTEVMTERAEGGVSAVWSEKNPLHGLTIMRAKSLGLKGMYEDPSATWDAKARRWRLLLSEFTPRGIRASMFESRIWDGGFEKIAGPVEFDSTGTTITWIDGVRYCLWGSYDRACYVHSYPDLKLLGRLSFDFPPWEGPYTAGNSAPWSGTSANGRVWPSVAELPEGYPFRFIMLTMDRATFPGMPRPNWTYGGLYFYGANP